MVVGGGTTVVVVAGLVSSGLAVVSGAEAVVVVASGSVEEDVPESASVQAPAIRTMAISSQSARAENFTEPGWRVPGD